MNDRATEAMERGSLGGQVGGARAPWAARVAGPVVAFLLWSVFAVRRTRRVP